MVEESQVEYTLHKSKYDDDPDYGHSVRVIIYEQDGIMIADKDGENLVYLYPSEKEQLLALLLKEQTK